MSYAHDLFQNTKREHYRRHAVHSQPVRNAVAATALHTTEAYGYFLERQAAAYSRHRSLGANFRFHESPGPVILPTAPQRNWVERLTDYVLAEDHAKGLALRTKIQIEAKVDEEYPPVGEGARRYMDDGYQRWVFAESVPEKIADRTKLCEVCRCDFADRSPNKGALVCGDECRGWKDKVRKRLERNDDPELKRYRERQKHEYPFYSPVELTEIAMRGESVKAEPEKAIDTARIRQERGRRKPTNVTMDSERQYFPNGHKRWRSEEAAAELAGAVITFNIYHQNECLGHVA